MQYKFFVIPVKYSGEPENKLNSFLASHRIAAVHKELFREEGNPYWNFVVEYCESSKALPKTALKQRIDYKEVLNTEDFALFSLLRDLRKKIAESEGIPVYTIFTNEQLAKMSINRPNNKTELEKISGIGEGKFNKYSNQFLMVINKKNETSKQPD